MSKLRLLTLVGSLAALLSPLYGCGLECADGTSEKDGQCVVAAKGCAEGTTLRGGECELDITGCGDNTVFEDGLCVPASEVCAANSTFDAQTRKCTPNTEVVCGEGTEVGDDGICVPGAEACSPTTMLDENGRCVIAAAACGQGTALEPNSGECILAEEACGEGLAIDADSGKCAPTREVCDAGTAFDADSGLCLNDSCNLGDVLIDGVCILPAEDLAANSDLAETENNDPTLGGTANTLFVNPAGDAPFVFTGDIGAPADLDGDGSLDQDVDVFEFEAEAGEWFEITVQSIGLQAPAFIVDGPDGFVRYSPVGRARDAAREIVAPVDGAYTVTVLPSMVLQTDGQITNFGSEDWTYVGTLGMVNAPDATQLDISSGEVQLSGDYLGLRDNLFELTNLQSTDLVNIDITASGSDVTATLQTWESSTVVSSEDLIASGASVDVSSDGATPALLLFDWTRLDGPAQAFEATAKVVGSEVALTMPAGSTETFTVSADTNDYVVAGQSNATDTDLDVSIIDALGTEVAAGALSSGNEMRFLVDAPGDFTVKFTNSSSSSVDATLVAKTAGLPVLGPLAVWDNATYVSPGTVPVTETRLHKLVTTETGNLSLALNTSPVSLYTVVTLFDSAMTELAVGSQTLNVSELSPGTYYVEIEPGYSDITYSLSAELAAAPDFSSAPRLAIPDNDTTTGAVDALDVSGCATITDLSVYLNIAHNWRGDLDIDLTSPSGTTVRIWEDTGSSSNDLVGWMPLEWTPANSLSEFNGETGNGEWTLSVYDDASAVSGTLNAWGLNCQ